jgi:pimeloyl-ACP methyl ester carboxylesterase
MTPIRQRFIRVGARRAHYLRAGSGPPAVLVHSSPANAWMLRPEIERLARGHTVFAFDNPGYGLSDALPGDELTVADLADALAETLEAIGMPPCPMFGTHTGAAIALELGARRPDLVTGLVLDGVPAFTRNEFETLFGGYFRKFQPSDLGGHYADVWMRFRDQSVWFPWTSRDPANLNPYDLSPPERTQVWALMFWQANDRYIPAYRAALSYGDAAIAAAETLTLPAVYCASTTDMLRPHLERLPPAKAGQEIRVIDTVPETKLALIEEAFGRFGARGEAPADHDAIGSSETVERRFIDLSDGGQLHLRHAGQRNAPALLLFHDAPGSAAPLDDRIATLGRHWFVVAPDLPGCGGSTALAGVSPTIGDYAAVSNELLSSLHIDKADVWGIGFGASVAVELARSEPAKVSRLILEGLLAPSAEERADLLANYAPAIPIEHDGAHWLRTWMMLRDSLIWFPWYRPTLDAQRARPGDFSAERLHRWTLDVMASRETYGQVIAAALAHDGPGALRAVACPVLLVTGGATPLSAYDDTLRAIKPDASKIEATDDASALAGRLRLRETEPC